MSKFRWLIFGVICALVLGGLVVFANKDKKDVSSINPNQIIAESDSEIGDHVYGNKDAKVVIFEYADFQCPSCSGAFTQLSTIKETYKDQTAFVFRNFPLTSIHPNALSASSAAEAAGMQGKFWEMYNALFLNQSSWSSASASDRNGIFETYANAAGVNIDQYRVDITGKKVADKISRDRALGKKSNVTGTPTIFIGDDLMNADVISNLVSGDGSQLTAEIDKRLKAAGVEPPKSE